MKALGFPATALHDGFAEKASTIWRWKGAESVKRDGRN
jgi:hypothetical protein